MSEDAARSTAFPGRLATAGAPAIQRDVFGHLDGREVAVFTLTSSAGLVARISELGATLLELVVPDPEGGVADVVLGLDTLARYAALGHYFGPVVGRVVNRVAGARFTLDGRQHALSRNHGRHHLHGGSRGFAGAVWHAEPLAAEDGPRLLLRYRSPDGEEGYPGNVEATVVYTLTHGAALRWELVATTDRATPLNLSQHSYWNLAGHDQGDVLDHTLEVRASRYTPADAERIPTGAIEPVTGPYDLRRAKRIDRAIAELAAAATAGGGGADGFDVNFVLDGAPGSLRPAARLAAPRAGRAMEVWTTAPGLQLYTGNHLAAVPGKRGAVYGKHAGVCLETQHFPDAIHHQGDPGWPSVVLRPGETYRHATVHRFVSSRSNVDPET